MAVVVAISAYKIEAPSDNQEAAKAFMSLHAVQTYSNDTQSQLNDSHAADTGTPESEDVIQSEVHANTEVISPVGEVPAGDDLSWHIDRNLTFSWREIWYVVKALLVFGGGVAILTAIAYTFWKVCGKSNNSANSNASEDPSAESHTSRCSEGLRSLSRAMKLPSLRTQVCKTSENEASSTS